MRKRDKFCVKITFGVDVHVMLYSLRTPRPIRMADFTTMAAMENAKDEDKLYRYYVHYVFQEKL